MTARQGSEFFSIQTSLAQVSAATEQTGNGRAKKNRSNTAGECRRRHQERNTRQRQQQHSHDGLAIRVVVEPGRGSRRMVIVPSHERAARPVCHEAAVAEQSERLHRRVGIISICGGCDETAVFPVRKIGIRDQRFRVISREKRYIAFLDITRAAGCFMGVIAFVLVSVNGCNCDVINSLRSRGYRRVIRNTVRQSCQGI